MSGRLGNFFTITEENDFWKDQLQNLPTRTITTVYKHVRIRSTYERTNAFYATIVNVSQKIVYYNNPRWENELLAFVKRYQELAVLHKSRLKTSGCR